MKTTCNDFKIIRISVFKTLNEYCQRRVIEAENGAVTSVFFVGRCFVEGKHNFPVDPKTGMDFLDCAVEMKSAEAMEYYGAILFEGELVIKNESKAVKILTEAVNRFNSCQARVLLAKIILSHQTYEIRSMNNYNINYVLAKKYLKEAAAIGSTEGMVLYGKLCMKEKKNKYGEIRCDYKEALRSFQFAACRRDREGMAEYGLFLEFGHGVVKPSISDAVRYYRSLYYKEDMTGYALYGYALVKGIDGLEKDEEKGLKLIEESKKKKNRYGIYMYSQCLLTGLENLPKDEYEAVRLIKKAIELGVREAIYGLGICLRDGKGIPKNPVEAIKYFKFALEEGCSYAANELGTLQVSTKKLSDGNKSFQYGAEHGDPEALYEYCKNMLNNKGVAMNVGELKKYLITGVNLDNVKCMILYADLLLDGTVLAKNEYEAGRVLKRASDMGDKHAMNCYATLLESGRGVIKDTQKAFELRKKASKM